MKLQENINRIKEVMGVVNEGEPKKDLSPMMKKLLQNFTERKRHIICDIEITAPWNRESIEPDKSFNHYKILVTFIGGPGTKYWPKTQSINVVYGKIMDEIWETVYNYISEPVDVYSKTTENCIRDNKEEMKEGELTERCWKGYTQKGMKTMFGKRYPNCVKIKK
jgi:hypothetical protein